MTPGIPSGPSGRCDVTTIPVGLAAVATWESWPGLACGAIVAGGGAAARCGTWVGAGCAAGTVGCAMRVNCGDGVGMGDAAAIPRSAAPIALVTAPMASRSGVTGQRPGDLQYGWIVRGAS